MAENQKVCIADWDGTLSYGYTAIHWLEFLSKSNLIESRFLVEFHRSLHLYEERKLSYRSLVTIGGDIVATSLKGFNETQLVAISEQFSRKAKEHLFPFVCNLISYLKTKDILIIVVSGAPKIALQPICSILGVDELYAVELSVDEQHVINGRVKDNFGLLEKKQEIVDEIVSRNVDIVLGIGNSEFDIPILEAAKNKIFVGAGDLPKPIANIQMVSSSNAFEYIKTVI